MKNFIIGLLSGTFIGVFWATIGFSSLCQEDPETTAKHYANLF